MIRRKQRIMITHNNNEKTNKNKPNNQKKTTNKKTMIKINT